jgi:hypothetical protein
MKSFIKHIKEGNIFHRFHWKKMEMAYKEKRE